MGEHKKTYVLKKADIINHLLQFIFIFSSVFFAIYLSNRNETQKLKKTEQQAIRAVHLELINNLNALQQAIPYHEKVKRSLRLYLDSMDAYRPKLSIEGLLPIDYIMARGELQFPDCQKIF